MVPACEPLLSWHEKGSSITVEGVCLLVSGLSLCSLFVYLDMLALFIDFPSSLLVELKDIEEVQINKVAA